MSAAMRALGLWVFFSLGDAVELGHLGIRNGTQHQVLRALRYSCHSLMKMKIGIPNEIG